MPDIKVAHSTISCRLIPAPDFKRVLAGSSQFSMDESMKGLVHRREDLKATVLILESGQMIVSGAAHPDTLWGLAAAIAHLVSTPESKHEVYEAHIDELVLRANLGEIDLSSVAEIVGIAPPDPLAQNPRIDMDLEAPAVHVSLFASGEALLRGSCALAEATSAFEWVLTGLNLVDE